MTFGTAHRPYESDDPTPPVVPAHAGTQRLTPERASASPTKKVSSLPRTHVFSGFAAVRSDAFACVGLARLRPRVDARTWPKEPSAPTLAAPAPPSLGQGCRCAAMSYG